MSRAEELIQAYATNTWLIGNLTEGLSHTESLLQPPFPTNCVNWILGHILVSRNESILLSFGEKMWDEVLINRYDGGSEPVRIGDDSVRKFEDLLKNIDESQKQLAALLDQLTDEDLELEHSDERGSRARWLCIRGLHWHETYHIGQLELLRSFILTLRKK